MANVLHHRRTAGFLLPAVLLVSGWYVGGQAQICSETPTTINALGTPSGCSQCYNSNLPGALYQDPNSKYYIVSDLPERFTGTGVVYSTASVLPNNGTPLALRTQTNNGFTWIDDNFDIFLFHLEGDGTAKNDRRMVVYVKNEGTGTITINPKQVIITDGAVGTVHEMENTLATRTLSNNWDVKNATVTLNAGAGNVIAYSKRWDCTANGTDTSVNGSCFGRVFAKVNNANPGTNPTKLKVYIVNITGGPISENKTRAESVLGQGVTQQELGIDLTTGLTGCEVRRANGVFLNKYWRNDPVTIDADALSSSGYKFSMALSKKMTTACTSGRQTVDALLYPGYAPDDNVGNYMLDYRLQFRLINKSTTSPRLVDLRFGKPGADIGLAYKISVGNTAASDTAVDARPSRALWAGPSQSALSKSLLSLDGGPVLLDPCSERFINVRFQIAANSSLPFDLTLLPVDQSTFIVDNLDSEFVSAGSWTGSVSSGYYGTDSLVHQGTGSTTAANVAVWRPNLFSAGSYKVYAWWVAGANRSTAAPFTINHVDGIAQVTANQTTNGGQWNLLGTYNLRAGVGNSVALRPDVSTSTYVSADAIKFEFQGPIETIVDNGAASLVGSWGTSAGGGSYGSDSRYHIGVAGGPDTVTWTPNLSRAGQYKVYAYWVSSTNRAAAAPFEVYHRDGVELVTKDQRINGSQWVQLGVFNFDAGTGGSVVLSDEVGTSEYVSADAVKFVYVAPFEAIVDNRNSAVETTGSWPQSTTYGYYDSDSLVNQGGTGLETVRFRPDLPLMGRYDVYTWWVAGTNRSAATPVVVHHLDGDQTVSIDQKVRGSQWNYLGSFNFRDNADGYVQLSDAIGGSEYVSADAVRFTYASPLEYAIDNNDLGAVKTGTWSTSATSGYYGTDSLTHAAGTGTEKVTFTPNLPEIGKYNVYGWWVASTNRATAAQFDITHMTGTTTVTADQTANGSKWNLLGTFVFGSGTGGKVVLKDTASAGQYVSADAVKFVYVEPFEVIVDNDDPNYSATGTWTNSVSAGYYGVDSVTHVGNAGADVATWTLPVPESGSYKVYAWWVTNANRATAAPYSIVHAGGTANVTKNQTTSGGQWNLLGTYTFTGGTNAVVSLSDNVPGTQYVSADAVRIVFDAPVDSPKIASFTRDDPSPTTAPTVNFRATFTKQVNGVDPSDFTFSTTGSITGVSIAGVTATDDPAVYVVTVGTGANDGTITLAMATGATVTDVVGNPLVTATPSPNQAYTVDHNDAPTNITLSSSSIAENSPLGTLVGTMTTTDPDTADTFTYSFGSPNYDASGAFVLDGNRIESNTALDYEGTNSYSISVTTRDPGGLTYTKNFTITVSDVNENAQTEVIIDNGGTGYSETGTWSSSSNSGYYGTNSKFIAGNGGTSNAAATWQPTLTQAKRFQVYAWWVASSNRSTAAIYQVTHSNGSNNVTVNQSTLGGQWVLLGTYTMHPSAGCKVVLGNNVATDKVVSADAVKFTPIGAPEFVIDNGATGYAEAGTWGTSTGAGYYGTNSRWASTGDGSATATFTPPITASATYKVYAWWVASSNRAPNATYQITHAGGTANAAANQSANGGAWNYLGTFTLNSSSKVVLPNTGQNGMVVSADAIKFEGQ